MSALAAVVAAALLAAPSPVPAAGPPVVWLVGDSLTARAARWLERLRPEWTVVDHGIGGERSGAGRLRLDALLAGAPAPDVAIVVYGTNDVVAAIQGEPDTGPAVAAANVHAMVGRLRAAGSVPIVALPVGTPPPAADDPPEAGRTLRALRRGLASLRAALRREHPRVDFRLTDRALFQDALHPTPEGGEVLGRRAGRAVARALRAGVVPAAGVSAPPAAAPPALRRSGAARPRSGA